MYLSSLILLTLAGPLQALIIPLAGRSLPFPSDLITENGGIIIPEGPDGVFTVTFNPDNSTSATIETIKLLNRSDISKALRRWRRQPAHRPPNCPSAASDARSGRPWERVNRQASPDAQIQVVCSDMAVECMLHMIAAFEEREVEWHLREALVGEVLVSI
ncbi:hypothetical protein QBC34DRAFT_427729 [Podospora aff. communis PSN243]|uniref:Uncharacterized protein n=1 Tax=Podospora aff. communis PSN243 TaxID=3040156 RepID=A0AAV9GEQ0_9PEZI|nr:hypothetical protein QBC34DRAFT_427729 [Podospora aff. communis PSN243]